MCDDMRLQITGLRERVTKAEANKTTSNKLTTEHTVKPNSASVDGDLLVGDSLLRNVKPSMINDGCKIKTLIGATITDIYDILTSRTNNVDTPTIVAGTNDCANESSELVKMKFSLISGDA